ncbi:ABC transporter substrate-binding protein [Mitsuokella sp. WILCCON 0060]|uniref:ABC transporter substrate-binding protein n=1 Tax=unclassified Mitsuokella TaxID=2637239 RepID=UPI003F05997E
MKPDKKKYLFLCMSILIFAMLLTAGCGKDSTAPRAADQDGIRTVRVAYLPITHALPLFEATEQELADGSKVRIELVKYSSWPELMDALNTGKVDAASVLVELAIKAREQGINVKAAALSHREGNIIVAGNDIHSVEDLRGKIFAIPHKQSSQKLLLDQMLKNHGMTEDDLTVVEMTPPEMPSGLAQGQISAYSVAEPFGAKSVVLGTGHILEDTHELWPDNVCCALVFNGDFLTNNHDLAKSVVADYVKAGAYLDAHPDEEKPLSLRYLKATGKVLDQSLQFISYSNLAITKDSYEDLLQRMNEAKLIKKAPSYEDFVDTTLLP